MSISVSAFSGPLPSVFDVLSEWGCLYVLTSDNTVGVMMLLSLSINCDDHFVFCCWQDHISANYKKHKRDGPYLMNIFEKERLRKF